MATAQRVSGTPTPGRSARVDRKRDGIPWDSPLTQVVKGALYRVFGWLELPAGYRYTTRLRVRMPSISTKCSQAAPPAFWMSNSTWIASGGGWNARKDCGSTRRNALYH